MVNVEKNQMLAFSVYDKKYERYNMPMFFPDVKTAIIEFERSIKTEMARGNVSTEYLKDAKAVSIGVIDLETGQFSNIAEDSRIEIELYSYVGNAD